MSIKHKMYDGKVTMEFDPKKHQYMVNGVHVPSVTKVTGIINKPALMYWAVNETVDRIGQLWQPERTYSKVQIDAAIVDAKGYRYRTSQKAMGIGSQAHDWIEQYIKSMTYGFDKPEMPDYQPVLYAVQSYLDWEKEHEISYISSERRVCSVDNGYSGTVDMDMKIDGERVVADLKTSKGIYPEYLLQCAGYAMAMSEEDGTAYDAMAIIRIPKDGAEVEVVIEHDIAGHAQVFLSCLHVWRWQNSMKDWRK